MTKERLEELIEQNGTVYDKDCFEIQLYSKNKCKILPKYDGENDYLLVHYVNAIRYFRISQLMDKEHFEWYCKTLGERTERFEPPMWEDIPNSWGSYRFVFSCDNQYTTFSVNKECNYIEIAINLICTYNKPATKENYIEACEKVKNLFNKGEKL